MNGILSVGHRLEDLEQKKLEVRVVEEVPTELTSVFTAVFNRKNRKLYICDTDKWVPFSPEAACELIDHEHGDLYYTETETDKLLEDKSDTDHTHSDLSRLDITGLTLKVVIKTEAYLAVDTDDIIECDGTFTVSLPTAVGITGKIYRIKNAGTGIITADPAGSETIDSAASVAINPPDSLMIYSNGTNWGVT